MYNILKIASPALVAEFMARVYDRGLTTPSGGNISMMDEDSRLWVTPSQVDKGTLQAEDIVMISTDGVFTGKHKPTMEYLFHQGIYEVRSEIKAVTHAHPVGLVTLSMMKSIPEFALIPILTYNTGAVGFSKFALPGSQQLCDAVKTAFEGEKHAILLENHGVITIGANLLESFHRLENLERMANIYINACRLGKLNGAVDPDLSALLQEGFTEIPMLKKHAATDGENLVRKSLLGFLKRSYARNLTTSATGCMSVRTDAKSFLISPFEEDIRYMGPHDMVYIEDGKVEPGKTPSVYWKLHQAIYQAHSGIQSIACMQPAAASAFSLSTASFETRTIPESYMILKTVPKAEFSVALQNPEECASMISENTPNLLLANDGLLVTGSSLFQVFDRLEVAEFTANSLIQSKVVGKLSRISDKNIREIENKFF